MIPLQTEDTIPVIEGGEARYSPPFSMTPMAGGAVD